MTKINVGTRTFTVLFKDLVRPLSDEEMIDLRASIKDMGVLTPIIVDEHDGIIDGVHRTTIAAEMDLTGVPVEVRSGLSNEQKMYACIELNLRRRQLTVTERRATVVQLRAIGKSYRDIAKTLKVSTTTVVRDVKPETRKKRGRARRQATPAMDESGPPAGKDSSPLNMDLGQFDEVRRLYARVAELINDIANSAAGAVVKRDLVHRLRDGVDTWSCTHLNNSAANVIGGRPYAACPDCAGARCKLCHGLGWVTQSVYESARKA